MVDVIIADHQELFRVGMAEILAVADDICVVGQAQSPEQLLSVLKDLTPHVLVLSTSFLAVFSKIQPMLKRSKTALLVLTEENDRVVYMRWLRVQGILYRSMDGPVILDVMRRVARGELFVQKRSSDIRKDRSDVARERTESRSRIPVILSVDEDSANLYARYKILQGAGYGVLNATDCEQALGMLDAYPVDLVLLDYAMHGTADEIRAHKIKLRRQNIPVIAVSATVGYGGDSQQSGLRCHNGRRFGAAAEENWTATCAPFGCPPRKQEIASGTNRVMTQRRLKLP